MNSIGYTQNNTLLDGKDLLINARKIPPMGVNLYYVTANISKDSIETRDVQPQNLTFGTEVSLV